MKRRICLMLVALGLAGCLPSRPNPPRPERLTVAPGETLLRLAVPRHGAEAMLKRVASAGGVETWMSQDRLSVSLQEGVLVATRGFGFDLMGSTAEPTLLAIAAPGSATYARKCATSVPRTTRSGCRRAAR